MRHTPCHSLCHSLCLNRDPGRKPARNEDSNTLFLRGYFMKLAGAVGFEPTVHGTKNRCLTTWLRPNCRRDLSKPRTRCKGKIARLTGCRPGFPEVSGLLCLQPEEGSAPLDGGTVPGRSHRKTTRRGELAGSILRRALLLSGVWAALVGADPEGWVFGALAVPLATLLSLGLMPAGRPASVGRLIALGPGFLLRSLVGGIDVARRAFDPRLPLRPGWMIRPVRLTPGGRVALGAELSLMPGTLAAGSSGRDLLVHVLDTGTDHGQALDVEEVRLAAVMGREKA